MKTNSSSLYYSFSLMILPLIGLLAGCNGSKKNTSENSICPGFDETFNYPVSRTMPFIIKPGGNIDTIFYMNENKIVISFKYAGIEDQSAEKQVWSEMNLSINYKNIDLYNAPHGPGQNQVGIWQLNNENDFAEVIKEMNGDIPIKLKTKLSKINDDKSYNIEVFLELVEKPKEVKEAMASFKEMGAGDLVHVIFKSDDNKEFDFSPTSPEDMFIVASENDIKNQKCKINYVTIRTDIPSIGQTLDLLQITNIRSKNISICDWWQKVSSNEQEKSKYKKMTSDYIQALWQH